MWSLSSQILAIVAVILAVASASAILIPIILKYIDDESLRKRAKSGEIILVDLKQFLLIQSLAPDKYSISDMELCGHTEKLYMCSKDIIKLQKMQLDERLNNQKKEAISATVDELQYLRNLLSTKIIEINLENEKVAKECIEKAQQAAQAEITHTASRLSSGASQAVSKQA